jgi:4-hydroxybenzoate polyprenyltransferase
MRDSIAGITNLLRLHTAGFEGLVFVLGPLSAGWEGSPSQFALLWLIGVLNNAYIFALNDLVDLPYDRQNPARARSPLVDGRISERSALVCSLALPLLASALVAIANWPVAAKWLLILMLILSAFVNVYQKATRRPLLMDLLFAVTMAAPLPITTLAVMGVVPPLVWLTTSLLFLLSLQLNSVAGNLKDLRADERTGFRTVALSLGATLADDGKVMPGKRYARYCWLLHGAVTGVGLLTLIAATRGRPMPMVLAVATGAAVASWWGVRDLRTLLAGRRRPSPRGREAYFAAGFALLLSATAMHAHWPAFAAAIGALVVWEGASAAYWRWYWRSAARATAPVG